MNINDIMIRDVMDAQEQERRRDAHSSAIADECAFPWLAVAVWLLFAMLALGAAFVAGMNYQGWHYRQVQAEHQAWIDRLERESAERARAMSNRELLRATERTDAIK